MNEELFGLSSDEWIAIGTIALVVVAGTAIFLNGRAGHHAKLAAQASKSAAEAAKEAVAVQMAGLNIKFGLYVRFPKGAIMAMAAAPITLTCGANLVIHELHLARTSKRVIKKVDLPCPVRGAVTLPKYVHSGENLFFDWPGEIPKEGSIHYAYFEVVYGFSEDGPTITRSLAPDMFSWV